MYKVITSYWSTRWNKYIIVQELEVNRATANYISRHFARKPKLEKVYQHTVYNSYATTTYYSDEMIMIQRKEVAV